MLRLIKVRRRKHPSAAVQGRLPFLIRAERRERWFKRGILIATGLILVAMVCASSAGRFAARSAAMRGWRLSLGLLGVPPTREEIEADHHAERMRNLETARAYLAEAITPDSPLGPFMRTVHMDAQSAVVRWGNFDQSLVLSSDLFEPDKAGRSYRMKPGTRSVWLIGLSLQKALGLFLVPDTPEVRAEAAKAGGRVVPESVQTTNSWGCRGPEPVLDAPVRVLVLGDSCMQGALIGDDETPPARLQHHLAAALDAPVSVLNTGHLGYSPEQYYHTLRAFGDRFRPQYVIISICDNDFGDMQSRANWDETEHWLDQITAFCDRRRWHYLLVPIPEEMALLGRRNLSLYPGQVSRVFKRGGGSYIDPLEAFTEAQIRLRNTANRQGAAVLSPLYNGHLMGDRHFSPLGADLWARVVARHLLVNWDRNILNGSPGPEPAIAHAHKDHPPLPRIEPDSSRGATTHE
jgi:lysophospholipase L1-like esterase